MGYSNVCRICESGEVLMIFKDENAEILQMLRRFTSTSIHINDGLPQYLCRTCTQQLKNAYKFKSMYEITSDKFKSRRLLQHRGINLVEGFFDKNPKTQLIRMIKTENTANNSATKSSDAQEHVYQTNEGYNVTPGSSVNTSTNIIERSHGIVSEMRHRCTDKLVNDSHGWNVPGWCMDDASEPSRSNISALSKEKLDSLYDKNAKDINLQNIVNIEESSEDYLEVKVVSESEADKLFKCARCGRLWTGKNLAKKWYIKANENVPVCDECDKISAKSKKPTSNEDIYLNSEQSQAKLYTREKYEKPLGASQFYRMNELLHSNFNIFNNDIADKSYTISPILNKPKVVNLNTKPGKYKCEECGKFFNKRPTYKNHLALHLNPNRYKCDICGKLYSVAHRLKIHKATHLNPDMYKCEICGKSFAELQRVKTHIALHSNPDLYKCNECGICFSQLHTYKNHLAIHLNPDLYKCDICGQTFTAAYTLKEHKTKHAYPELFKCDECGKTYTTARNLNSHKASHTGRNQYKCQECGKSFSQTVTYKNHLALHSNPDLHKCEICGKSFTVAHRLKSHRVIHFNPDLYKCEVCGKSFTESYLLKVHKAIHSNPDLNKCNECGKTFNRIWHLRDHKALHSDPNIYTCKECGRSFSNSYYMRRHMKTHRELECDSNLTDTSQDIAVQEHPPPPPPVSLSMN